MADGNVWKISELSISSPDERFSNEGKMLKSMWMLGPSKAVISKGVITDLGNTGSETSNTDNNDNAGDASTNNKEQSTNTNSEAFCHTYSILEAFSHLHKLYEDSTGEDSNQQSNDNSGKDNEAEVGKFSYSEGNVYEFNVGIVDEGYTTWKVAIDSRADAGSVKNAIRAKKFKEAYNIASKSVKSDGLVPLSCTTYIRKAPGGKKDIQPPFIGHCRYAIDSGYESEYRSSGDKDGLTLCLAVAPINGRTKKPDEDVVIQAVYNVTGDITGGVIGKLAASATSKIRDKALGTDSSRYKDSDDKDSEESQSDELSDWLHKKFRCVGDHTMYNNFKSLREFIKKQVAAGNLELEALFVGNGRSGSHPIDAQVSSFFKSKKFVTFF